MRFWKSKSRVVATVVVTVLLVGGAWLAFKPSHKATSPTTTPTTTKPTTSQTTPVTGTRGADPAKIAFIETADFKYQKPAGWAEISPTILESTGAASGIGRPTGLVATFTIKVSDSTPKDSNDLKNGTLNELKKFTNFQLASNVDTKVDGKAGQKFVYNFTDAAGSAKTTQQMSVVTNNGKTFFLLFSSATADYDKQTGDFSNMLANFKLK